MLNLKTTTIFLDSGNIETDTSDKNTLPKNWTQWQFLILLSSKRSKNFTHLSK